MNVREWSQGRCLLLGADLGILVVAVSQVAAGLTEWTAASVGAGIAAVLLSVGEL